MPTVASDFKGGGAASNGRIFGGSAAGLIWKVMPLQVATAEEEMVGCRRRRRLRELLLRHVNNYFNIFIPISIPDI